ncbi:hypothetical protein BVRB_9g211230 [Beta vulgaris subsp. vulgaris]|nr:hypothetical protein BVRB_9g211230 [Beta vulgaris subsp. vulgaris]
MVKHDHGKPIKKNTTKLMVIHESLEGLSLNKSRNINKKRNKVEENNNHGGTVILEKKRKQPVKAKDKLENLIDVVEGKIVEQSYRKRPRKGIPRRAPFF